MKGGRYMHRILTVLCAPVRLVCPWSRGGRGAGPLGAAALTGLACCLVFCLALAAPVSHAQQASATPAGHAREVKARVIASAAVIEQVGIPQQVCEDVTSYSIAQGSGADRHGPGRRCTTETVYEDRTVGYDVTYEYAGRRHVTRVAEKPGRWIVLQARGSGLYHSEGRARSAGRSYSSRTPGVTVTESIIYEPPKGDIPIRIEVQPFR